MPTTEPRLRCESCCAELDEGEALPLLGRLVCARCYETETHQIAKAELSGQRDRRESTAEEAGIRAYYLSAEGLAALGAQKVHCKRCYGWSAPGPVCAYCLAPRDADEGRAA